ncbi:MAG: DUF5615 family PIN-like protein [Mycobacteriales bacterium]|nr:DUF5615 family PIN-like protein [Mycobacteriales bacterium]
MRLLLDEMLGEALAQGLRDRGFDVEAVVTRRELVGASDDVVLAAATAEGRVVVTFNIADFVALDQQWRATDRTHAGVLLLGARAFPQDRALIGRVVAAVTALGDRDLTGSLRFLQPAPA